MGWAGGKVWRKFPLNWEEFYPQKVLMKLCFHLVEIFLVHEIAFPPAGQIPPNFRRNFLLTWSHELGPRSQGSNPRPPAQCKGEGKESSVYAVTPPEW